VTAAVVLAVAAGGGPQPESQKIAVEDCSTRSEASFPGAFTDSRNLVAGPLAMMGAGEEMVQFFADFGSDSGGQKFQLLVRNGHRVTVKVPRGARQSAGLAYGPLPGGQTSLSDTHHAVKFIACKRGVRSGSSADGQPVTFWSGGVLVSSPQCVPLRVVIDRGKVTRRVIHLGVRDCLAAR